jgi:hypothetical protein
LRKGDVQEHLSVVSVPTACADDHAILGHLLRWDALDGSAVVLGGVHLTDHGSDRLAAESPAWGVKAHVGSWRERATWPLIVLRQPDNVTLPLGLASIHAYPPSKMTIIVMCI